MKKILTYGLGLLLAGTSPFSLTSCIDEAEMTNGTTAEQTNTNPNSPEYFTMGIPAQLNTLWNSSYAFAWGYPAIMHIRDVQTEDLLRNDGGTGYNWFVMWSQNVAMGRDYLYNQFIWNTMYECINSANNVFEAINQETITDEQRGYIGAAHAYRAMLYLDLARCYEWLPNDRTEGRSIEGNDITGLTVPIVREGMTEEEKRANPRATKEAMAEFILSDLNNAEQNIGYLTTTDKTMPHLDCVYGLYARYYLWLENYPEAERYARLAINETATSPISETAGTDPISGFNNLNAWMWGLQYTESSLQHSLMNWVSWMSNEVEYGYASVAPFYIDAAMYNRISNTDWRKLLWQAPEGGALEGKNSYCDPSAADNFGEYASLKFRPNEGNTSTFLTASASAVPMMRVEEMMLIEAEAAAHQNAARGVELINRFMQTYRDPAYQCSVNTTEEVVEEIIFQKRVELWGEGHTFFDIKRLNYSVTRGYSGTNHVSAERFNTDGRPAWMNYVIVRTEEDGNTGVRGYNNPDPTGLYAPWNGR